MNNRNYWAGWLLALGLLAVPGGPETWGGAGPRAPGFFTTWTVSEFQPDIPNGGRANCIAVHPKNNSVLFVASESGGVFHSTDRGQNWKHVDGLPPFLTNGIAFLPGKPQVMLATAGDDFKTAGGGGVWRSTDGGTSWSQTKAPAGITGRLSAYEISIAPDTKAVYVGSEFGCLLSTDEGASWKLLDVFKGGDRRVFAVVALGDKHVLAGGPGGVCRSDDAGTTWSTPVTGPAGIFDIHALGRSPLSRKSAYVADGNTNLFHTEDAGKSWAQIKSAPTGGGGCGGICFVFAVPRTLSAKVKGIELYFSNRCGTARLFCPVDARTGRVSYTGKWENLKVDHGDTRHLAFDSANRPLLLGTDGGLHETKDGGANWAFVGGGRHGYNALQITEVTGQTIDAVGRHDLYFGTQDNHLWSSGDSGKTWKFGMCCEGFFIECQRRVATVADAKITNVSCSGCGNHLSGALFSGVGNWPDPKGDVAGNPKIVRHSMHIQGVNDSGGFSKGLAVTFDLGKNWKQFVKLTEDRRDIPRMGPEGSSTTTTIIYQAVRTGWDSTRNIEINHLVRIHQAPRSQTGAVHHPAMKGFGGLGIDPTMFAWYQVYGIDPGNPYHLIAPDVINEKMMESHDGGESWKEIPQLTKLVTDNGRLLFRESIFPIASTVSFCPQDPRMVIVGTREAGLFLSHDNGATWARIPGTEKATLVTSAHWRSANDVIVSTYGRGLWHLQNEIFIPRVKFEEWCKAPCIIRWFNTDKGDPPPDAKFQRAILVYEGRIQGARAEGGVLKEVFVTPGSSVVWTTDAQRSVGVRVVQTSKAMGFVGVKKAPAAPKKGLAPRGLVLSKDNRLLGAVFGEPHAVMATPKAVQHLVAKAPSPTAGKPYVHVMAHRFGGAPAATLNKAMPIQGRGLPPGAALKVFVNGKPVTATLRVNADGTVQGNVPAPKQTGLHRLVIRHGEKGAVVDGFMFFVRHEDKPEAHMPRPKETGPPPLDKKKPPAAQGVDHVRVEGNGSLETHADTDARALRRRGD
jgi:photosystem II stability/assembly factor-like uncharacterized protein